jgi:hypothetical protein
MEIVLKEVLKNDPEKEAIFNKIKSSIIKIDKAVQVDPTKKLIKLYENKYNCNLSSGYLKGYLSQFSIFKNIL